MPASIRSCAIQALLLVVAGCTTPPPAQKFPELSWSRLPPIVLKVSQIEVVKAYVPSDQAPHVEALPPRTLIESADRWARDRLQTGGGSGFARFIITDASMVEVALPVHTGLAYAFTTQQAKRYDAHVAARLEILDASGKLLGQVMAEASNSRSVPQDVSQRQLNETWYLIVEGAMVDLNSELDRNIHAHLGPFLRP